LASISTPLVTEFPRETLRWSLLLEGGLVLAAICAVFPGFAILAANDTGRDGRFAEQGLAVRGLPDPVLPGLCATYGSLAENVVRDRLCARTEWSSQSQRVERLERMPRALASASDRATQAFVAPLQAALARRTELRQQQQSGVGELLTLGDAIDVAVSDVQPFLERYAMTSDAVDGPRPLSCAFDSVQRAIGDAVVASAPGASALSANAVLLLGAAFDGHPATQTSAAAATLPGARAASARCAGLDMRDAIVAAAALMADARATPLGLAKNEAMRDLLHTARWQWAGWAGLGLVLLHLARRRWPPAVGAGLALAAWATVAWIGRVPWPFEGGNALVLGRESASLLSMPANFVVGLLVAALCVLAAAPWLRSGWATTPQREGSVLAYPGVVLLTGLGWLILLDLSANGHFSTRYLALYHQGHLWLGMLIFTLAAFVRQPLGRSLAWCLSLVDGAASRVGRHLGGLGSTALLLCLVLLLNAAVAAVLLNVRQLTSEIGRLWLIVGAAWFFFLRGTPFTERLARSGDSLASLFRYIWPLLFVVVVLIGAMVITRDMGPLLIAGYAAGAFVAASVAMWRYQRSGATGFAYALAVVLFASWIVATTAALFQLGAIDDVTAARLENAAAPLASANDQLALITWFQRAAPYAGFGPGVVPWCGFGASGACAGVPAQIQSDYTFTALIGMLGWTGAWAVTLGCIIWLYDVVRCHARVTQGEPRLLRVAGRVVNDEQALLSWLAVTWMVLAMCQLAVTVAGNLAVIPLTGVTFPFVSFGMTSLAVNMAMLGLAANVNVTEEGARG
jgi:cell division protein FtsW (lipid II flippase)